MNLKKFKLLRGYSQRPEFPVGIVYVPYVIETQSPIVVESEFHPRRSISARYYGSVDPATNYVSIIRRIE
jgi:hypothetical protein